MASARQTPPSPPDRAESEGGGDPSSTEEGQLRADSSARSDEFSRIVNELRAKVSGGCLDLDQQLAAITMVALQLTGATGAAMALRTAGAVLCRARAGETAPPLGTGLDTNSGISGECLRTGAVQECADVDLDPRVDAEVSRSLGVRSLVAVPLLAGNDVLGILEIFSGNPHAFDGSHVKLLQQLAEVAISCCVPAQPTEAAGSVEPLVEPERISSEAENARPTLVQKMKRAVRGLGWGGRIASVIALFALLGGLAWMMLRASPGTAARIPTAKANTETLRASGSSTGAITEKPSPMQPVAHRTRGAIEIADRGDRPAGEVMERASNTAPLHRDAPLQVANPPEANATSRTSAVDEPGPPGVSQVLADSQGGSRLPIEIVPTVELPVGAMQVSQGVTGGKLVRRIAPVYPAQARAQRIEGDVILEGIVGPDGGLHNVKVVSGDPLLAYAATQAVAQWHYDPYLLNGKPTSMPTRVTIQFKLPQ